ncbi:MAG: hypothetical protein KIT84_35445 [Labilithrix sp.]|nr:hypothetical protein [Labilithrix sp.]MCW5816347.1 hypothetical protein [Labilithrix sp.]
MRSLTPVYRPRLVSLPRISDVAPRRAVERSRRDFLAWLGAGAAVAAVGAVGCTASAAEEGEEGSELLGADDALSTDVDAGGCRVTTRDALGPYYAPGAPIRTLSIAEPEEKGVPLLVEGRLLGPDCRTPLKGYTLDLWQANAAGEYSPGGADMRLRGKIVTDQLGRYSFESILPGRYSDAAGTRPAHIHVTFRSPAGNALLTSQIYFAGDPFLGEADYCTRAGACNAADEARHLRLQNAIVSRRIGKRSFFDAILPRT